jgi:hypothetical protein
MNVFKSNVFVSYPFVSNVFGGAQGAPPEEPPEAPEVVVVLPQPFTGSRSKLHLGLVPSVYADSNEEEENLLLAVIGCTDEF